jgi:elongation factor P
MITPNDFRVGTTFRRGGQILRVIEFLHVKPGKGPAFVRAKIQNLRTGAITEETFRTEEKLEDVRVERRSMVFLYMSGNNLVVMDSETFDQIEVPADALGEKALLLSENQEIFVDICDEEIIGVELPALINVEVVETEPGVKGDTATTAMKPAVLKGGARIQVPLFVKAGDLIKVDTRSMAYVERVKRD